MGNTLSAQERRIRYAYNQSLAAQGLQECSRCKEVKPFSEYSPYGKKAPGKYYSQCKACTRDKVNRANRAKQELRKQTYKTKCDLCDADITADRNTQGFCCKAHRLFVWQVRQYRGDLAQARKLYAIDQCEICGSRENLCIDHSHKTGKLRGRLCSTCNASLGHFYESTETMRNAIEYLTHPIDIPVLEEVIDKSKCRWCGGALKRPHPNRKYCSTACKHRAGDLSDKFGISVEQYKWLDNHQGFTCACCKQKPTKPVIDHSHTTSKVRGITCFNCNLALGHSKDDPALILSMIEYLDKHRQSWEDWSVVPIESKLAREIAIKNHYLHRSPNVMYAFGLYQEGNLLGICTFGSPSSMRITNSVCPSAPKRVIELNRLWIEDSCPAFAASWFVSRCLKQLPAHIVISYADTGIYDEHNGRNHDGTVYRALNFNFAGQSKASVDWRLPGKTRNVGKKVPGSVPVPVPPKNRYWILTGNKREKGQMHKICIWPSLDYAAMNYLPKNKAASIA